MATLVSVSLAVTAPTLHYQKEGTRYDTILARALVGPHISCAFRLCVDGYIRALEVIR